MTGMVAESDSRKPLTSMTTPKSKTDRPQPPPFVHLVAGGLGGMCGSIVTAPFDVVKTRLQSNLFKSAPLLSGPIATKSAAKGGLRALLYNFVETTVIIRDIYRYEGISALFRGLGPTLVGVIPGRSINFFVYGNGKNLYAQYLNDGQENAAIHLTSAATAGLITATATNPIWVVKTLMQLEAQGRGKGSSSSSLPSRISSSSSSSSTSSSSLHTIPTSPGRPKATPPFTPSFRTITSPPLSISLKPNRVGSWTIIAQIYKVQGIAGFYRGLSASYLGVTEGTIQWAMYEQFKLIAKRGCAEDQDPGWRMSAAAGAAKFLATIVTYPHEVIRTRLRQPVTASTKPKYHGLIQSFNLVLREEGWRALYGGLSPHLMRVIPNAMTMFYVYEKLLQHFDKRKALELKRGE